MTILSTFITKKRGSEYKRVRTLFLRDMGVAKFNINKRQYAEIATQAETIAMEWLLNVIILPESSASA